MGEASAAVVSNPQGMLLQAAMEKQLQQQQQQTNGHGGNTQNRAGWRSVFRRGSMAATDATGADDGSTGDESDTSASKDSEAIIAGLKSEIVKISASHKEELYVIKKKITQLECENEALALQNATLEQLSRFHNE